MPFFLSPADNDYFAAIGRLTVAWAHLELGLDATIDVIHRHLGGEEYDGEKPRSLKRKIAYLKSSFARMPITDEHRPKYARLLSDIATEAVIRHDVIHGAAVSHVEGTGQAKVARLLPDKEEWRFREVTLTAEYINSATSRVMRLSDFALSLAVGLQETVRELAQQLGGPDPEP